jgi:SNF2 family DNA or RNA helicase
MASYRECRFSRRENKHYTGLTEPGMLPALVVCPTHLPTQWKTEIERCTDLTVHILKKGTPYNITREYDGVFPDVVIANYHKIARSGTVSARSGSS